MPKMRSPVALLALLFALIFALPANAETTVETRLPWACIQSLDDTSGCGGEDFALGSSVLSSPRELGLGSFANGNVLCPAADRCFVLERERPGSSRSYVRFDPSTLTGTRPEILKVAARNTITADCASRDMCALLTEPRRTGSRGAFSVVWTSDLSAPQPKWRTVRVPAMYGTGGHISFSCTAPRACVIATSGQIAHSRDLDAGPGGWRLFDADEGALTSPDGVGLDCPNVNFCVTTTGSRVGILNLGARPTIKRFALSPPTTGKAVLANVQCPNAKFCIVLAGGRLGGRYRVYTTTAPRAGTKAWHATAAPGSAPAAGLRPACTGPTYCIVTGLRNEQPAIFTSTEPSSGRWSAAVGSKRDGPILMGFSCFAVSRCVGLGSGAAMLVTPR